MDFLPDIENLAPLLRSHPLLANLTSHPLQTHLSTLRTTYLDPYIIQPFSTLLASTSSTPDLLTIFLLITILLLSLKILDYARRIVMWWVWLVVRLLVWGVVLGVGWYVWRVGVEQAGRDLGWYVGVVQGLGKGFWRGFEEGEFTSGSGAGSGYGRKL